MYFVQWDQDYEPLHDVDMQYMTDNMGLNNIFEIFVSHKGKSM